MKMPRTILRRLELKIAHAINLEQAKKHHDIPAQSKVNASNAPVIEPSVEK